MKRASIPNRPKPRTRPELHIEQTCSDFLALDGWRTLKTDPVSDRSRGKGFGELGMADGLYIRYTKHSTPRCDCAKPHNCPGSEVMWIEWKSKSGTLKLHQRTWHEAERARGALTLIAEQDFPTTIEGFQAWYRASGLMRKKI